MIKILLVDDHALVRTGIRRLIEDIEYFQIVGEAASGEEAVKFVASKSVDIILMDLNMPGMGGMEATRRLVQKAPKLKVIVVTIQENDPFPQQMFKVGAMGYLTKGCKVDEIIHAIHEVSSNRRYISIEIAQKMALKLHFQGKNPFEKLSQREMQVMMMTTQGMRGQQISEQLTLSPKTISTYRHRVFDKLEVKSDVELARLAQQYGLVDNAS